jgi:predicted nucleotidyltransferase
VVTLEDMRRTVGEREAEASRRLQAEVRRLRSRLPAVAAHLRALGATDVVLFGSLAEGRFREDSDVDLAVRGLDWRTVLGESVRCADLLDRHVDLVRLEEAPPSLLARIAEVGVPVP